MLCKVSSYITIGLSQETSLNSTLNRYEIRTVLLPELSSACPGRCRSRSSRWAAPGGRSWPSPDSLKLKIKVSSKIRSWTNTASKWQIKQLIKNAIFEGFMIIVVIFRFRRLNVKCYLLTYNFQTWNSEQISYQIEITQPAKFWTISSYSLLWAHLYLIVNRLLFLWHLGKYLECRNFHNQIAKWLLFYNNTV
jgi:hypothetical protein